MMKNTEIKPSDSELDELFEKLKVCLWELPGTDIKGFRNKDIEEILPEFSPETEDCVRGKKLKNNI